MATNSLIAVIVSPDRAIHGALETALRQGFIAGAVWVVSDYPELASLERLKEAQPGCVLFLDFSDPIRARRIAIELDRAYPFVSVVAIHNSQTKDDVIALMQLGVREIICSPICHSEVYLAFNRAAKKLKSADSAGGNIYAFLPARPGAGATDRKSVVLVTLL